MLILIPKPGYFDIVENKFTIDTLHNILSNLYSATLTLSIPTFSLEAGSYNLKTILSDLGMPDAFQLGRADFSGIDGTKSLFIESIYHKGYIDVNEKGVEAAASSVTIVSSGVAPNKTMSIDHPFILFIRDRRTKTILFMGRIIKL